MKKIVLFSVLAVGSVIISLGFHTNQDNIEISEILSAEQLELDLISNQTITEVLEEEPDKLLKLARESIDNEDYQLAITHLDQYLKDNPDDFEVLRNKGAVYGLMGNYTEAIEIFDIILEKDPENSDTYYNKGQALNKLGKNYEATKVLLDAVYIDEENENAVKLLEVLNVMSSVKIDGAFQLAVRDKNGLLAGYLESNVLTITNSSLTSSYLNFFDEYTLVEKDGEPFAFFVTDFTRIIEEEPEFGVNALEKILFTVFSNKFTILTADIFGYPFEKGDNMELSWSYIIPF